MYGGGVIFEIAKAVKYTVPEPYDFWSWGVDYIYLQNIGLALNE